MDITISLTDKQFEKITDFLKMFSININTLAGQSQPVAPAVPVMPKKYLSRDLTTTEKVMKVLSKLWKEKLFVQYSDLMRQGHFTAAELKPALTELKEQKLVTFFQATTTGVWDALFIGKPDSTEDEFENKTKKKIVRHKIPCWLVNEKTQEWRYFECMNDAWRFLGIGRGNFRPSAKHVDGYVCNGWKFVFGEDNSNA